MSIRSFLRVQQPGRTATNSCLASDRLLSNARSITTGGISLIGCAFLVACANVTFHSDAALTQKTGLKFYQAKPYLLVEYIGAKDNPIKIEVISLPDLEHPTYALYTPGLASH